MKKKLSTFARARALTDKSAIAFSAALLERMLTNYQLFSEATEFGDASEFRTTLNCVWEWLSVPKAKMNFATRLERIEEITPDAADFDMYGVYPAIDTAMSMQALLQLILGEDLQGAVVVSKLSQGSVEAYILQEAGEDLENQQIAAHPLMQWEVALQNELLDIIEAESVSAALCKQLRTLVREEGISNIGIELTD